MAGEPVPAVGPGEDRIVPDPGERAVRIDDGRCFTDDTITLCPARHVGTDLANDAAELMAQDDWIVHLPADTPLPHVQVTAAHADSLDFEQNFVGRDGGFWNLA